jgi:hypothetical protein
MGDAPVTFTCKHVCTVHVHVGVLLFVYLGIWLVNNPVSSSDYDCHIAGLMAEI